MRDLKKTIQTMAPDQLNAISDGIISIIDAIDRDPAPQIGDRCIFWDSDSRFYTVDVLGGTMAPGNYRYLASKVDAYYRNCKKLTREAE
ncbi:MAG: hypothetical protein B6I30_09545 [Desulfobacteraceae bacterium 4572_187]|nr:MAG: hypothetical protein B6I30_09545 [Desulfobacteraceae bacterium 4572_187]